MVKTGMSRSHPLTPRRQFSREGFEPLTRRSSYDAENPPTIGDATLDIPLTKISTTKSTGARRLNAMSPLSPSGQLGEYPLLSEKPSNTNPIKHKHHGSEGFIGRRQQTEARGLKNKDPADGTMNALGKFYRKIYNFSIITRYLVYVLPLAALLAIPIIIGAKVNQAATIGGVQITWFFAWIEVVWVSLWVSKLFSKLLPYMFQFLIGAVSTGTRKYSAVITALEIPLSLVFWSICSLTTFVPLMTLNPQAHARKQTALQPWEKVVKNILFACLFSTLVLLVEKLLIQLISISYHRKQFDNKITESKRNIYLIGLLYEASRNLFPTYCREFAEEDYLIADMLNLGLASRDSRKRETRSGTATPMKLFQNAVRVGDKVTTLFGNVAQEITGKQVFNGTSAHSVVIEALEKKKSSEALARRIWLSFVLEGREALYIDDIKDVLGADHETEAEEAFECLDLDGNGDISLDEMILRVNEFGHERASIANSMHDVDQAINVLDNLLCTIVFIAVVFIFVAWLNTNFTTTLATTGTALLSLSFVFATTCQEVLGSCIFLFVKHPYDVGDRVDISNNSYVVERISLLYTIFRSVNNHKRTQVPNIVLNTNWIDNVTRSKAMREQLLLYVSFDTTLEDVELLREEMQKFVVDKDNARDFQPIIDIEVTGIAEMNKLELKVEIRHKSNWANEAVRAARRSKFMCALVLALKKVPIYAPGAGGAAAGDKANPTYSVSISHDEAEKNKTVFSKEKDEKRMIPLEEHHSADDEGRSTAINTLDSVGAESRERNRSQAVQIGALTQRNVTETTLFPVASPTFSNQDPLERQRSRDIEEVRTVLRRESVSTGKRRANQHDAISPTASNTAANAYIPPVNPQSLPMIPEPAISPNSIFPKSSSYGAPSARSPPIQPQMPPRITTQAHPIAPPPQQMSQYPTYEGQSQTYPQAQVPANVSATVPPRPYVSAYHPPSQEQTQSQTLHRGRSDTLTSDQPTSQQLPDYGFPVRKQSLTQSASGEARSRAGSSASRKPVPGIGEMKGYLQSQGQSQQPGSAQTPQGFYESGPSAAGHR